jgi:hypothetical protein
MQKESSHFVPKTYFLLNFESSPEEELSGEKLFGERNVRGNVNQIC